MIMSTTHCVEGDVVPKASLDGLIVICACVVMHRKNTAIMQSINKALVFLDNDDLCIQLSKRVSNFAIIGQSRNFILTTQFANGFHIRIKRAFFQKRNQCRS